MVGDTFDSYELHDLWRRPDGKLRIEGDGMTRGNFLAISDTRRSSLNIHRLTDCCFLDLRSGVDLGVCFLIRLHKNLPQGIQGE